MSHINKGFEKEYITYNEKENEQEKDSQIKDLSSKDQFNDQGMNFNV